MRFDVKCRLQPSQGLSLVELLIYLAILGMLSVGVGFSIQYFQDKSAQARSDALFSQEAELINAKLRVQLTGSSRVEPVSGYNSVVNNGNYCYQISENKPVTFNSTDISNGALFQYRVAAATTPTLQNAEPKLASLSSLGLGASAAVASVRRSLSIWVRLPNVEGNNRVLFDYSPDSAATSYKMVVRVANGNAVGVDMGMGLTEFIYNVSNIRNGEWHHLVVTAGDLSMAGSSPTLYVDGSRVLATANSASAPSNYVNNLNYKINIGDSASAFWAIGPVGFWNRSLTEAEIAKLGRLDGVNVDNAFWLRTPLASLSTASGSVTNGSTVNARVQKGFLLFKKEREESEQTYFKIYNAKNASNCPNPALNDDPVMQGFELVATSTCASPSGEEPLLVGANAAGQGLGFQWRCNLSNGKQQAAATVVTGNNTSSVIKSDDACGLPIESADFATTAMTNTAFIIIDNFDVNFDLMSFKPATGANVFPNMNPNTDVDGDPVTAPNVENGTVSVTWFADSANNVGMMKVVASADRSKSWWVTNVFKKIIYKSKTDVYAAEKRIVFALGDAWPIKVCPGLGYKANYHFYKLMSDGTSRGAAAAYQHANDQRYFGMTGYLANMRCPNEKDQVSLRVLERNVNNVAIIGAWTTRQESGQAVSTPNFSDGREEVSGGNRVNHRWHSQSGGLGNQFIASGGQYYPNGSTDNVGNIQWRWIGGPAVDHNVIMHTDSTICNGTSSVTEDTKKGCRGMNTVNVQHACVSANTTSPACRIQNQSGGNRQYGWWEPGEPNESGSFIWMGYLSSNYWDDAGEGSSQQKYLLEFGDHPWDAVMDTESAYKTAHATANDTSTDLDPPNVATKRVRTLTAQYCK